MNIESTPYNTFSCCNCGVVVVIPGDFIEGRRRDHREFYCPNGHYNRYESPNEAEKIKKALADAEQKAASTRDLFLAERERAEKNWQELLRERAKNERME